MNRLLLAIAVAALAASTGNTQPASLKGFQDEGTFGLYVNEERVGTLTFKWSDDGSFTNEAVLAAAGQTATTVDTVTVDAEGRWTRLETKSAQGTVTTVREGDTARRTFKEKADIIDVKPGSVLFSNYGPALMAGIVRQYDKAKGSKQPLTVIVLPGAPVDGSLEFKERVERSAAGKDLALEHYLFELRGIEIHLYTDATGKVYLAEVPQQRAAYVRDGFEALRKAADTDPLLSKPMSRIGEKKYVQLMRPLPAVDPTPDPRFYELTVEEEKKVRTAHERRELAEAYHESVTAGRRDMLVYQTEPLEAPLTIAGPVTAVLHASTTGRDTDWFMNLVEVDAKGRTFWLSSGRMRARHRVSTSKPVLLKPGQAYRYTLDLWHTGIRIPAGNRLRVEISSAQYPTWSRNLNTGRHSEVETKYVSATQTIFHDAKRPSHIVLPVIPPDKPATTMPTVRR